MKLIKRNQSMAFREKVLCIILIILTVLTVAVVAYLEPNLQGLINLVILILTLIVLIVYAYDTRRIANQSVEANLRPVILRSGDIPSWDSIKFSIEDGKNNAANKMIEFKILKNIAKDIEGYIVLSNKKYSLLWGSNITGQGQGTFRLVPSWGWMEPGNWVWAAFDPGKFLKTEDENSIYITYKDIVGNTYFTKENCNFSQDSGKL